MGKVSRAVTQFNRICKQIEALKTSVEKCEKSEQSRVKVLKEKLKSLEQNIENAFSDMSQIECDEFMETLLNFQDLILDLGVELETKSESESIKDNNHKPVSGQNSEVLNGKECMIKLPKLEIPNFYGDNDSWISFKELFQSSILNNSNLSQIEKLQYLQTCVKGPAFKLIRGFPLKDENLKNCWEILCNRFENKRQLAINQLNKVFSLKLNKIDDSKSMLLLIDTVNESVRNLTTLGLESHALSDLMFVNFMLTKLDNSVRQRWELSLEGNQIIPDLESFRAFIEKEAFSLTKTEGRQGFGKKNIEANGIKKSSVNNSVTVKDNKCVACSQMHQLFKCPEFSKMAVQDRWNLVKSKSLCRNCLRSNHEVKDCRISVKCKACSLPHHSSLHIFTPNSANQVSENSKESVSHSVQSANENENFNVLLSTALIDVRSPTGKIIRCRALIDNASQNSLISKKCATVLQLQLSGTSHRLVGINGISAETCLYSTTLEFSPYFVNQFQPLTALVVNRITTPLPNFQLKTTTWPHITNVQLADPNFAIASEIDILLGADIFGSLICGLPKSGQPGEPCAIPTILGYILTGKVKDFNTSKATVSCHSLDLKQFFEIESIPTNLPVQNSEILYTKTVSRTESGRYMVDLPFKETPNFGDSESTALKRFHLLETKLEKNPNLKLQYHAFMQEYLHLNHMEAIPKSELESSKNCFYLPHHAVIKEDSSTTKLRVVFDASATASSGHSLNDVLEIGPKLQPDLLKILLKFRSYSVALTGDIEKMYRQILINPKHTDFQRIFWRFNSYEPISTYRLLTVTYGTSCAPFLAIRTLHQLAKDYSYEFPDACRVILEEFYVDDLLSGAHSNEEANQLISDLNHVLNQGGFTLRKWASNETSILENLPEKLKSTSQNVEFSGDSSQKILGLVWNSKDDVLKIHIASFKSINTKRELLSTIARIYDPLGILSPTTILLKIMMQDLWKDKIPWDDPIPNSIMNTWLEFNSQIDLLKSIGINRYFRAQSPFDSIIQLHGFCDGSGKAYAAVIYFRSISSNGKISINFVVAKTRVNPIKHVTLPRIELCAAYLLSQLCSLVVEAVPIVIKEIYLWSDSQIVLNWINSPPTKGNQFVTNRATHIKSLVPQAIWTYVPSSSNPADCASRGIFPKNLVNHKLWWTGPEWLHTDVNLPLSFVKGSEESKTPNEIMNHVTLNREKSFPEFLIKFSSYSKLCRIVAYCRRFIHNSSHPYNKHTGMLNADEISNAINVIMKQIQEFEFPVELKLLKTNQPLPSNSKYLSLNIFLDEQGFIRVGGRLSRHQSLNQDQKYPILLPKNHAITTLLIQYYHKKHFHASAQLILSLIRQKFWFVDGRSVIRHVLKNCILCKRLKGQGCQQMMGDLPPERITPIRPFSKVGIDFAGPIITKPNLPRSKIRLKSYICVIVCMSTKAIHIEVVSDLSAQALLAALRRFTSRRGLPSDIFSDNGKNFKGVSNHLKQLFQIVQSDDIQNFISTSLIKWHFIPPYSPHFGGLWESAVKLTKNLLVKACKTSILNFEELTTLLCQIEACLNSRPLTPLSSDPADVRALTPGHFLIGVPLLDVPDVNSSTNISLSARWNLIQKMKREFWNRWTRDYLHHLQQRPKWCSKRSNLQINDLVIIHEPNSPPLFWRMGRIAKVFPGRDNQVRVIEIHTKEGMVKRPITKVTLLLPGVEDV